MNSCAPRAIRRSTTCCWTRSMQRTRLSWSKWKSSSWTPSRTWVSACPNINSLSISRRKRGPSSLVEEGWVLLPNRRQDRGVEGIPHHLRENRRHGLPHRLGVQSHPRGPFLLRSQTHQRQHRKGKGLDGAGRRLGAQEPFEDIRGSLQDGDSRHEAAAALFLEAVPTFGSYELMSYDKLILYTVITSVFAMDRPDLRLKVIRSNEIQERVSHFECFSFNVCLVEWRRRERRFDSDQELLGLLLQLPLRSVLRQLGFARVSVPKVRPLLVRSLRLLLPCHAFEVLHAVLDALQNG